MKNGGMIPSKKLVKWQNLLDTLFQPFEEKRTNNVFIVEYISYKNERKKGINFQQFCCTLFEPKTFQSLPFSFLKNCRLSELCTFPTL